MDPRELVRNSPGHVVGHQPVTDSLNVRKEAHRFSIDPLNDFIAALGDEDAIFFHGDIGRYRQAYSWYALSLRRSLQHCSTARRADKELRWHPVNMKYSVRQKKIAEERKTVGLYQELDYQNLIIHTCILLDRLVALSRRFLHGNNLPSFTSFRQHKKFFKSQLLNLPIKDRDYAERLVSDTDWFEVPLKVLRDKFLMHSAERHLSYCGWSTKAQWDLEMVTVIRASHSQAKLLEKVKVIRFSPRRLARDIESFLSWFSEFGQNAI